MDNYGVNLPGLRPAVEKKSAPGLKAIHFPPLWWPWKKALPGAQQAAKKMEWGRVYWPLLLAALGLGIWEGVTFHWEIPHYLLPAPSDVVAALIDKWQVFARHTSVTMTAVVGGGLLGIAVGLLLGLLLFLLPPLERGLYPFLITSQNVPVFAIAPLLVLWFGYGIASKVAMAAIIVFFPVTLAVLGGLQRTDVDMLRLFKTMGASRWQVLWKLRLPYAMPAIFAGIKLSVAYSTIGAVIGEWVGAGAGLGYLMLSSNAQLRIAMVFGAIVCLTPIGLLLLGFVSWLERRLLPWQTISRNSPPAH